MIPAATKYRSSAVLSNVLLHLDGTNGSTTFTDVYGHTFTAHSGAALATAQAKFGTASLDLTANTGWISTPDANEFHFTGDFTVEGWYRPGSFPANNALFGKRANGGVNDSIVLFVTSAGKLRCQATNNGSSWGYDQTSTATMTVNTWSHWAAVRSGSTITCYLDGTGFGAATLTGRLDQVNGADVTVGADAGSPSLKAIGYIDEFRFSPVARYTSNFTPAGPFTS